MTAVLCVSPLCGLPRRHLPDVAGVAGHDRGCRGCLPARADDGLLLCGYCCRRQGDDATTAARLYADLEGALVRAGRGGDRVGSSSGAPVPDDEVMDLRDGIFGTLMGVAARISRERGVSMPAARPALAAVRTATRYDGSTVVDGHGKAIVRTVTRPARPLEAVAVFIGGHVRWLAARTDAGEVAADLRHVARDPRAYALAYPAGSTRLYIGDCPLTVAGLDGVETICGERLHQYPDAPLIICAGCGTEETVEQWQRWIAPAGSGEVDAYAVAADLSLRWCRPVDPTVIRQWASRGRIQPVLEPDPRDPAGKAHRPKRDRRQRVQYVLEEARVYARTIWGPEPLFRRTAAG